MIKRKSLGLAGAVVVTAVVVGGAAGMAFGSAPSELTATGSTELGEGPVPSNPDYPVNANGQTYGSLAEASVVGEEPDLTLVGTRNGEEGYIFSRELDTPDFKSPEEAGRWSSTQTARDVDVFLSDGVTRIGSFTIGLK